jgi:NADH:ubiquinone oxidoreductase subunit 6 (subunit J)
VFTEVLQLVLMFFALVLAFLTVEVKRILYAVISFSGMCVAIGALFWILDAPYVAVFQILIYAGAVVTIFLAAIMLTSQKERLR